MRRFEKGDAFWEIGIDRDILRVRWGTRGGAPKSHDRRMAGAEAKEGELIAARLAEGYVEVAAAAPAPRQVRRLACRYASLHETVEMELAGHVLRTRIERRDRDALVPTIDESTVEHASEDQAVDLYRRVGASRAKAGMVLVFDGSVLPARAGAGIASDAQLEAGCRAAPDDPAPWAVYSDWLSAQGDPRGDIAALHRSGRADEALAEVRSHALVLVGPAAGAIRDLAWRHGFVVGARLREHRETDLHESVEQFLASPLAAFVEALRFGLADRGSSKPVWTDTVRVVCASPRAAELRELRFDDFTAEDRELSWVNPGDFSAAWTHLPALEVLAICGGEPAVLGELDLPALRRFTRETTGLGGDELAAIIGARWPRLESLELWLGSADRGAAATIASLGPILDGRGLPALTHLGLVNTELSDELVSALPKFRLLPRLRTLDLSKGILYDARGLVEHAGAFGHLERIDLAEIYLTAEAQAAIRAALPNAVIGDQREPYELPDPDDDPDVQWRYVAVSE